MRMLFLITILGFLFIMANKSPDQSIGEATNVIISKSEALFSKSIKNLEESEPRKLPPKRVTNLPNPDNYRKKNTNKQAAIPEQKSVVKNLVSNQKKIYKNEKVSEQESQKTEGVAKNLNLDLNQTNNTDDQRIKPKKKTGERSTTTTKLKSVAAAPPPSFPKTEVISTRPIPSKPNAVKKPDPEILKDLKQAERKYYNDASRILMSIK